MMADKLMTMAEYAAMRKATQEAQPGYAAKRAQEAAERQSLYAALAAAEPNPCPLCGGPAEFAERTWEMEFERTLGCVPCGLSLAVDDSGDGVRAAVETWGRLGRHD